MRLLDEVRISKQVFESGASWKMKYEAIFARHDKIVRPLLQAYDIGFTWCDPDADYEDDVRAYAEALARLEGELEQLPEDCFDYADSVFSVEK